MFRWIPYAMVRITAFFTAGIIAGLYWPTDHSEYVAAWIFVALLLGYFVAVLVLKESSALKPVSGGIGLLAIFVAGYLHVLSSTEARSPSHISRIHDPVEFYLAEVTGPVEEKINSIRVEIEIRKIKCGRLWRTVSGKSLLSISGKSPSGSRLSYGDVILVAGAPAEVPPPANPGEFDYKRFLSFRNISHQQLVRPEQIKVLSHAKYRGVLYYSQEARAWAAARIQRFISGSQNQAIALALVLGITDGIDNDLQSAYAASGTMHVLSVSGLHVGIIYGIILFLLRPLSAHSWSRWSVAALSLICLWAYAFITGGSPSVLRAVTMFSFIAVARPFARDTNIYNTLAASAFLLLLYNPFLIASVGFQLSYLAVAGIVYLQGPLYRLWEPTSLFWDKLWQVTCVSLAAQAATFSLGLFYFHQFPVYFLFSNLVVIPLSVVVLVMGVLLLAVSPLSWLATFIGILLQYIIALLNGIVVWVEALPWSVISGVNITALQCVVLMGTIIFVVRLFESRKFQFVYGVLVMLIVIAGMEWRNLLAEKDQDRLIVYRVQGHGALEWIKGSQSYFYPDSALAADKRQLRFHIQPNRVMSGVGDTPTDASGQAFQRSFSGFRFFLLGKTTVLWIDDDRHNLPLNGVADYLIVGNDAVRSLERLSQGIKFKKLILDSSNSAVYATRMAREAGSRNIPVHSVLNEGAFVVNL